MAIQTLIAGLLASALVVGLGAIASAVGSSNECEVKAVSPSTPPASKAGDCAGAETGRPRG